MLTISELETRASEDHWYAQQFGTDPAVIAAKMLLVRKVLEIFRKSFSIAPDARVAACFVPGRVEVLGKHTDYAGGHSLLAAIDRGLFCISARSYTGQVRLVEDVPQFPPCAFEISPRLEPVIGHWSNYPMTMVKRLAANFPQLLASGMGLSRGGQAGVNVAFGSDLPLAGGLSGSSALMIMTFFALALPNRIMENDLFQRNIADGCDLAMYLACAENGQTFRGLEGGSGVGTFGGSEDHTQILNARAGKLSVYQFCPTQHKEDIAIPDDLALVIGHSGVEAAKTGAAMEQYNLAARRARVAVTLYNERHGTSHQLLRDIANEHGSNLEFMIAQMKSSEPNAQLDLAGRLLQFYREDREFIPVVTRALAARDYATLGKAIDRSHACSRTHLRNIIPEIDCLQQSARELGAVAASGFGAGFGGSAYSLVRSVIEPDFTLRWREAYLRRFPQHEAKSQFFPTAISGKATELFG